MAATTRPLVVHVTTTDMSLALLLGPQLEAFSASGYRVIGASAPGPYVEQLEASGIRHLPLRHASRKMAPMSDLRALTELRSLFASLRPAVVHTHNPKPGLYGRLAARAAGVPAIVNTVHGLYALPSDPFVKRGPIYAMERLAAMASHAELVQNLEDIDVLRRLGVPRSKVHLLGNGVDLDRFDARRADRVAVAELRRSLDLAPSDVVCGVVGRLVWEKGYREVFEAARVLRLRRPEVRFVVVGPPDPDKPDAVRDADLAAAAQGGRVRFLGLRHDMETVYAAFDLYVLASHREGFPRSAMEAAAMGLPIVATDIRGCRQVVEDGRTGHLVPVRDPMALAQAVEAIVGDSRLRADMAVAARAKAEREFDQRRVIDITLGVYERLLARNGDLPKSVT